MPQKKKISEAILKKKIIKRIGIYSEIYSVSDLERLNFEDLNKLQKSLFIKIQIAQKYRSRRNR
jgi:hypothetical protein